MHKKMRGTLVKWDDARGYGFIKVPEQSRQVYLHIKAMRDDQVRPQAGQDVEFTPGPGRKGGPAAFDAVILGLPAQRSVGLRILVAATLIVLVQSAVVVGAAPLWTEWVYALMGMLSYRLYQEDKRAAAERRWRIREISLNLCDLAFGIIGGLIAQHMLNHKTGKASFIATTGLIAALHLAVLTAMVAGLLSWPIVWKFFGVG